MRDDREERKKALSNHFDRLANPETLALRDRLEDKAHEAVVSDSRKHQEWLDANGYKRDENGNVIPRQSGQPAPV